MAKRTIDDAINNFELLNPATLRQDALKAANLLIQLNAKSLEAKGSKLHRLSRVTFTAISAYVGQVPGLLEGMVNLRDNAFEAHEKQLACTKRREAKRKSA